MWFYFPLRIIAIKKKLKKKTITVVTNMEHCRYSDKEAVEVPMTSIVRKPQSSNGRGVDFVGHIHKLCGNRSYRTMFG
ncbi:hypothetical protein C5167_037197 [Papaver somniferum]|uniref:Uncharacterized protein n=1 Tax=Papaver somniferum TaxID=3469 RepID=A0A4Y7I5N8_PAPSO|nr:hypothetical protein C5167_037197 [Papaver somniferum]